MQPQTRYAKSGDIYIAYQVFGDGPLNVVFAPPAFTNVEHWWDGPDMARWLLRLASYARVVMFDKRGTGLSDRVTDLPGLDHRMDDLRTVMDAVGMEQAALLAFLRVGRRRHCLPRLILIGVARRCSAGPLPELPPCFRRMSPSRTFLVTWMRRYCLNDPGGRPCAWWGPRPHRILP
jgi:pimeloyl-ACP methyl ester carboxylesterase